MQVEDFDKKLIHLHREESAIWKQIWNLGWKELKPPIQRGFIRFFILRDDVRRTKEAPFFEKLLDKINTSQWSYRKDFKRKRKRFGKKVYVVREQRLDDVGEKEFFGKKFTEQERSYFYETLTHSKQSKKPVKVYRFTETWRFILRVEANMITKVRIKDLDLERKRAEIDRYFDVDRRNRLWKLLHGTCWGWNRRAKDKYKDPFHNRSFADILDEYLPESTLRISHSKPRTTRGFSFFRPSFRTIIRFFMNS